MLWAFIALIGTIALAVLSLLIWPIRLLIRKMRGEAQAPPPPQQPGNEPASAPAAATKSADAPVGPR
jgi:hypothetical protein